MYQKGFTLIEVMIVVAIIGLLAAIALPSYNQQVRDSRRADAMAVVVEAGGAMERYFTENNSYNGASFTGAGAIFPDKSPIDGTDRFYTLVANITNGGASYNITATPQNAQAAGNLEGVITLFSSGGKTWDEDNSGGISATENDWRKR